MTAREPERRESDGPLAIVGIGASAGGLRALEAFLGAVPPETGLACVVVQHLDPNHESEMAELLQNHTRMEVSQVEGATSVEPGHVYVIPPNASLVLRDGQLHLGERPEMRGGASVVDLLFRSLAEDLGERAVGVVLSGTGSDGSVGLKAVKEVGGLTLVQEPEDAEYDGMPANAIAAGHIDVVAPARALPERLLAILSHAEGVTLPSRDEDLPDDDRSAVERVLGLLRERTGRDFSKYKRSTVMRRLGRRMQVLRVDDPQGYLEAVRRDPSELDALQRDLLISVTNFFRDPEAQAALAENVLPGLFESNRDDGELRGWVAGCATGEEAYSLTMLLCETRERLELRTPIQMFATDVDEDALQRARRGVYPTAIRTDVSDERLARFFRREGDSYRVVEGVRDLILFARHDLLQDPPFSHLSFVSCRNLLIYLEREAQQRVLEVFHYALEPDGVLFLGNSELADGVSELFAPIDKRHRIYRRRAAQRGTPMPTRSRRRVAAGLPLSPPRREATASFAELHERLTLRGFAPPSILVNGSYDIVHVQGAAGRYLLIGEGEGTHNLLRLARPGLRNPLRGALYRAMRSGESTHRTRVRVHFGERDEFVALTVVPLREPESVRGFVQVVFERVAEEPKPPPRSADEDDSVAYLEEELARTRTELQSTVEELEAANEELNASNEELQSTNEELQSTNEELETSHEELQSTNEELVTVNSELREKIEQVNEVNADLANLLASTDIATLFLDRDLRVKRYTPAATELFNLIPADTGRPFAHVSHRLEHPTLVEDVRSVLDDLQKLELELDDDEGRNYILRMLPYRSADDRIDGVVLTAVDVTARRQAEAEVRRNEAHFRRALQDSRLTAARMDDELRYTWIYNPHPDFDPEAVLGRRDDEIADNDGTRQLMALKRRVLESGEGARDEIEFPLTDGEMIYEVRAEPLRDESGAVTGLTTVSRDVTGQRRVEQELRASEERFRTLFENAAVGVGRFALDGRVLELNDRFREIVGRSREEMLSTTFQAITHPDDLDADVRQAEALAAGEIDEYRMDKRYLRPGGETVWVRLAVAPLRDAHGAVSAFVSVVEDITARKEAEAALQRLTAELEARVRERTRQVHELSRKLTLAEHRERHRIARVLHDDLQQELYALQIVLHDVRRRVDDDAAQTLGEADASVRRAIDIGRTLTSELSPPVLGDEGLPEALQWLARHMRERYGLDVTVVREAEGAPLATDLRVLLFQAARELLFNVVKHAHTDSARVRFGRTEAAVEVVVEDGGVGFDERPLESQGDSMGLATVRRRLELLGGGLELERNEPSGTRATVTLPLQNDSEGNELERSETP